MKPFAFVFSSAACLSTVLSALAQGSLTPPGAPAPTMKTLSQIEPRIPITSLDTNITASGSYYLVGNLTAGPTTFDGIGIEANNVTLDLGGFTLFGNPNTSSAISVVLNSTNITIRNGTLTGWGDYGVDTGSGVGVIIDHITASANGQAGFGDGLGISTGSGALVINCTCVSNLAGGIFCDGGVVSDCVAYANVGQGITGENCVIKDCSAQLNSGAGISASGFCTVSGCSVSGNSATGIFVQGDGNLIIRNNVSANNTISSAAQGGIFVSGGSLNRIEENSLFANGHANLQITNGSGIVSANNVVIKNTAFNDGANNYLTVSGNDFGPIGSATNSTSPWANISH